jgi:rod shape-determining protein MreC
MESFFGRYKNALVLMLVLLAQVVLLAMQVRRPAPGMPDGHNVRLWRYLVTAVITPPERLAHGIGKSVRDVWSNYIYLHDLRKQNLSLQEENDRLRLEQASFSEDAAAGQRLREMLDFRGRYIDKTIAAQVIGTSGTDQARDLFIDRGSKDGLQVQMPVITPDGIVGKIKNVFPHTAQVLLISDQTSGTGVLLESTRVRGVMKGNASGQPQMINISPDERIKPGEAVITSGGDQVYPPGMPVGVVDRVMPDPDSSYVNVVVKPNSNLGALEEVLVVVQFSDKMPFAQQKDMMQSEIVALAAKQRASDVLSEKLPSLRDPNAPETPAGAANEDASKTEADGGDPARPMRPPQALHPDRYTPGAAPPAEDLTPGAAPPGIHRAPSTEASATVATPGPKSTAGSATASNASSDSAPVSRFPAKPVVASVMPAITKASSGPATVSPVKAGDSTSSAPTASGSTSVAGQPHTAPSSASGQLPTTVPVRKTPIPTDSANAGTIAGAKPSASSATGVAGQPRTLPSTASGQSPTTTAVPVRKTPTPPDSDSGGILTPAGMGTIASPPRPRPTAPPADAAGNTPQTTTTPKPVTPKPQTAKPQTPAGPPANSQQPATAPPGAA